MGTLREMLKFVVGYTYTYVMLSNEKKRYTIMAYLLNSSCSFRISIPLLTTVSLGRSSSDSSDPAASPTHPDSARFLARINLSCVNVNRVIKSVRNRSCGGSHVGKHRLERRPIFTEGRMVRSVLDSMKLLLGSEAGLGLRKRASEARLTDRQALFARSSKARVRVGRSGSWMLTEDSEAIDGVKVP